MFFCVFVSVHDTAATREQYLASSKAWWSCFYAWKQLLLSARLSHLNSVCLSVCSSVARVDQSKTVQATITKSSPSAARKTLVSGTMKLFHKFEGGHLERGR